MSTLRSLISPLRYPGSKRHLSIYVKSALDKNNLKPALYVEPFVGGGSVALQLLQCEYVESAILMDIDPWVTSFWKTVFFDSEWLTEQIRTARVTLKHWQNLKYSHPRTIRDQAWACLFLNRTSFSGILSEKAGPLGGIDQDSEYKIDCRFPRSTLIARIEQVAKLRNKISGIWCLPWEEGMTLLRSRQRAGKLPSRNLFFYFDPPYFAKAESLYRYYFSTRDHLQLRNYLINLKSKWVLSYDSPEQVATLYKAALQQTSRHIQVASFKRKYSISNKVLARKKSAEVILTNLAKWPQGILK